jgi:hypothetical protein
MGKGRTVERGMPWERSSTSEFKTLKSGATQELLGRVSVSASPRPEHAR